MAARLLNSKHARRLKYILPFGVLFALVMFIYFPDYAKLLTLKRANRNLNQQIEKTREEIAELKRKLDKVGKDPSIYEKAAREELGAARESEIVIDIVE